MKPSYYFAIAILVLLFVLNPILAADSFIAVTNGTIVPGTASAGVANAITNSGGTIGTGLLKGDGGQGVTTAAFSDVLTVAPGGVIHTNAMSIPATFTQNGVSTTISSNAITVGNIKASSVVGSGPIAGVANCAIQLNSSGTGTGYIEWWKTTGPTRLGYMGLSTTDVPLTLENGAKFTVGDSGQFSTDSKGWNQWPGESTLASDQTSTSASLASTTLSVSLVAGKTYTFQAELFLSDSTAADGAVIDFGGGTATATTFIAMVTAFDTALNLSSRIATLSTTASASTFTGNGVFEVHGTIFVNAGGTFIPRFAQAVHTLGTLTLAKGSFIRFFQTP